MNTKTLIAAALFTVFGAHAAFAQEAIPATWANESSSQSVTSKTRAEVKNEIVVARAQGLLNVPSDAYGLLDQTPFVSTKSRAQVVAEYQAARSDGSLDARGELFGVDGREAPFVSARSRAEVKADVQHALAGGQRLSQGEKSGS